MSEHFPKVTPVCTNLFSDSKGEPSVHGFVQVVVSKCARRFLDETKAQTVTVTGFTDVNIKRAKTAIDRNRAWALHRAEELIKQHPSASEKVVRRERGSDSRERGIYVVKRFEQHEWCSKDGACFATLPNYRFVNDHVVAQTRPEHGDM